jgi:hypothetical protein
MSDNKIVEMLKNDMTDAAYRVASTQMTNGVRKGLVALLKDKGMDGDKLSVVTELLDSEAGASLIHLLFGFGLTYVPHYQNDPRVTRLAEEFRIAGMTTAGNAVIGTAMEYLLPALQDALKALPAVEETKSNVRVSARDAQNLAEMTEEKELEEEESKPKQMSVST